MPADSKLRRRVKQGLVRLNDGGPYRGALAASKAFDIRTGSWSEPELDLVGAAVAGGDTALDLGANFGLWTYHLSRAAGRRGKVLAFEPIPFTYKSLRLVTRMLRMPNVEAFNVGCGERADTVTFDVPLQDSGALSTGQAHFGSRADDRPGKEDQVRWATTTDIAAEVVALDEFLPLHCRPSFLKADLEGAEVFAFRGAREILARALPTVVCEINPWFLAGFDQSVADLTTIFFENGYALYRYDRDTSPRLRPVAEEEQVVEDNYIFVHPSRLGSFDTFLRHR